MKKILLLLCVSMCLGIYGNIASVQANTGIGNDYNTYRTIDQGTFNEYRYTLTQQFFQLRSHYSIYNELHEPFLKNIEKTLQTSYKYLPDNLQNKNHYQQALTAIQQGIRSPQSGFIFDEITKTLGAYIQDVNIPQITGSIQASPVSGNAPLTTTLRAEVSDPSGTQILPSNYRWFMNTGGKDVLIGRGVSLNYTFRQEGKFSVFLDVTSSHKNVQGYTDVLPLRERIDIQVQEQLAIVNIQINGQRVRDNDILKFDPEVANYGLMIDASNSIPTGNNRARFTETSWDFGNGLKKRYAGPPRLERIRYANLGDYPLILRLTTNEGKVIETRFVININNPVAKIEIDREEGYIGDRFKFNARNTSGDQNISYHWEIIEIESEKIVFQRSQKTFSYTFTDKGKYNIRLNVRKSTGEIDRDTTIITINSRSPKAVYIFNTPRANMPNRVYFDATRSFDPDMSDNGRLEYAWYVNGDLITLEESKLRGATGYYTFPSLGTYMVNLEVTDPDGLRDVKQEQIRIDSTLSVHMNAIPRVVQREGTIRFVAESPEAEIYEWDFGDGRKLGGKQNTIQHVYNTSGTYNVTLTVTDKNNIKNTITQTVYIAESESPFAMIDASIDGVVMPRFDEKACNGKGAYVVDRVSNIRFDAKDSINIDGSNRGIDYSWKVGNTKFATTQSVNHRFDELGCFPVSLTVRSTQNGKTHKKDIFMQVVNLPPVLSGLELQVENEASDPVVVKVSAQGAKDLDGVVQSYMWYYYTDIDREPQDFRSTRNSATSFVLPRITGTYYFVAILRDNNEKRITSEEILSGERYFIDITGDNIHTPLVRLSVDKNTISVGEEVNFTASAENILGQNIEKDSVFHWDFNGDGFYNVQTSTPNASFVYRNSGEYFAKVKVTHRAMSSTRNLTINVSNKLVADFGYFSIGNKYIFFDTSLGEVESRNWDMGDGQVRSGNTFMYEFSNGEAIQNVTLRVSEGTKVSETTKEVVKNVRNLIKARKEGIVVFSYPDMQEDESIILEERNQKLFIYLGESSKSDTYAIDYDIDHDSDLNGSSDDDEDNYGTPSYLNGSSIEIPLSAFREQTIRIFLKNAQGEVTASKDITITKEYLEDSLLDADTIVFENVSESEKQKLEKIKQLLSNLPQNQKLTALQYIQQLQQNWFDQREKTRTIIDFSNFLYEQGIDDNGEITTLLESLLVEGQEDQSQKQIQYQALINLLPQNIECSVATGTCYDTLISKITDIRNSDDIEYNRKLGKEVLEVLEFSELMTDEERDNFKAILEVLVYRGYVDAIPEERKNEIINETQGGDEGAGGVVSGIITFFMIILYIILGFICILGIVYIIYKIKNPSGEKTFREFLTFSQVQGETQEEETLAIDDIFGEEETKTSDIFSQKPEETEQKKQDDILSKPHIEKKKEVQEEKKPTDIFGEKKPEVHVSKKQDDILSEPGLPVDSQIPDWLKGSFESTQTEQKIQRNEKAQPQTKADIPTKTLHNQKQEIKTQALPEASGGEEKKQDKEIQKVDTHLGNTPPKVSQDTPQVSDDPEDIQIPDWLKGGLEEVEKQKDENLEIIADDDNNTDIESEEIKQKEIKQKEIKQKEIKQKEIKQEEVQNIPKAKNTPQTGKKEISEEKGQEDVSKKENLPKNMGEKKQAEKNEKKDISQKTVKAGEKDTSQAPNNKVKTPTKQTQETRKKQEETNIAQTKKSPMAPVRKTRASTSTTSKSSTEDEKTPAKTDTPAKTTSAQAPKKTEDELWDDGMKIPDWLKYDDEDDSKTKQK